MRLEDLRCDELRDPPQPVLRTRRHLKERRVHVNLVRLHVQLRAYARRLRSTRKLDALIDQSLHSASDHEKRRKSG